MSFGQHVKIMSLCESFKSIGTALIINKMNNAMKEKEVYMLNICHLQKINHYYIRMT